MQEVSAMFGQIQLEELSVSLTPMEVQHLNRTRKDALKKIETKGVKLLVKEAASPSQDRKAKASSAAINISVITCDVNQVRADCLVNAANEDLAHKGGIAYAIARQAGTKFIASSNAYIEQHGKVPSGSACVCDPGNLAQVGVKHIINAVAPIYMSQPEPEPGLFSRFLNLVTSQSDPDQAALEAGYKRAILSALELADEKGCKSIAIPAIGTGVFGWDISIASELMIQVICDFQPKSLREVVLFDRCLTKTAQFRVSLEKYKNVKQADVTRDDLPPPMAFPDNPSKVWKWKDNNGKYVLYDWDQQREIELAYEANAQSVRITGDRAGIKSDSIHIPQGFRSAVYDIDFKKMKQINVKSQYCRDVRRDDWKKGDPLPALFEERKKAAAQQHATYVAQQKAKRSDQLASTVAVTSVTQNVIICGPPETLQYAADLLEQEKNTMYKTSHVLADLVQLKTCHFESILQDASLVQLMATKGVSLKTLPASGGFEMKYLDEASKYSIEARLNKLALMEVARQNDVSIPSHWKTQTVQEDHPYSVVKLSPDCAEYKAAAARFCDHGFKCKIESIERIENYQLWHRYSQQKAHLSKFRGHGKVGEVQMVHGTRKTDPGIIMETGFDFRHASEGYYGRGCYFAYSMTYSHNYSFKVNRGKQYQAFIGLVAAGESEIRQKIDRSIIKPKDGYDSVRGLVTDLDWAIIIYNLSSAYPQYLVTYSK